MEIINLKTSTFTKIAIAMVTLTVIVLGISYFSNNDVETASENMQKSVDTYVESIEINHDKNIQKTVNAAAPSEPVIEPTPEVVKEVAKETPSEEGANINKIEVE